MENNIENKNNSKLLNILAVIHGCLEQMKFRAIVLLPPLILCIIGDIVAIIHALSNFSFVIPSFIRYGFIVCAVWLLLSMLLVLWSDDKRGK